MTLRTIWVLAHRYAGLAMAVFLILVGLTGSLLAFLPEISHALTPHLFPPSRQIKWRGSAFRINFDLHRAGGLWLALFAFAWSSVGFNLHDVYRPLMGLFFDMPAEEAPTAAPPTGTRQPMGWLVAQATADRLMREQGRLHGFRVIWPNALYHKADRQRYFYRVRSSADVDEIRGRTWLEFDDQSGRLVQVSLPTGQHSGTTVTSWLYALHMAHVFGMPYRIFVCALGLAITMLSVTGIVIWLRKRRAHKRHVIPIPTVRG